MAVNHSYFFFQFGQPAVVLASAHPEFGATVLAVTDGMVGDPLYSLGVLLLHVSPLTHWTGDTLGGGR